jgi:CRISPR/Cas system-associated protein Cas10 (large subunit of type III CRISPR-Cas system)
VKQVCTIAFQDFEGTGQSIVRAAGNIKHIFTSEEECKQAVRHFPRKVMIMAPGIFICQAVVDMKGDNPVSDEIKRLDELIGIQRNRPVPPLTTGLTGIKRYQRTGLPAVLEKKEKGGFFQDEAGRYMDMATVKKKAASNYNTVSKDIIEEAEAHRLAFDLSDMIKSKQDYNWLAVIHVDGNNLGKIFRSLTGKHEKFSERLDKVTKGAAKSAYNETIGKRIPKTGKIPFRPVILGGDDLTVICRADFAIAFTQKYLQEFQAQSKNSLNDIDQLPKNGLTACAGIAFVKSTYPFHYAIYLAELLCKVAKTDSKERRSGKSCLMFHKVRDSFIDSFDEIEKRELTIGDISFKYGPYYVDDSPDIQDDLLDKVALLQDDTGNAIKSDLRVWLNLLHQNKEKARQHRQRMFYTAKRSPKAAELLEKLKIEEKTGHIIPEYDWLSILSIQGGGE